MKLSIAAYLINIVLFALVFFAYKDNRYLIANNFVLACFAILEIVFSSWELFVAWYGGYLPEMIAFYNRALGSTFTIFIVLRIIVWVLPLLNLGKRFRGSVVFQMVIIAMFFIPGLIQGGGILNLITGETTTSVIPGWHTPITMESISYLNYFSLTLVFFVLSLGLVYFKILPEFKMAPEDRLYDSIIDKVED